MGRTRKPCPGCGVVDPKRKADQVCSKCNYALQIGRKFLEEEKEIVTGKLKVYDLPNQRLTQAIQDLVRAVGNSVYQGYEVPKRIAAPLLNLIEAVEIHQETLIRELLEKLVEVYLKAVGDEVFTWGVRTGLDFLRLLASGQVSLSDLDEFKKRPSDFRKVNPPHFFPHPNEEDVKRIVDDVMTSRATEFFRRSDYARKIRECAV